MSENARELANMIARELAEQGKLIEAGWVIFSKLVVPPDAPEAQLRDMRIAFFAGAQHLWGSLIGGLDGGVDATAGDERRMDRINAELTRFADELKTIARQRQ